MLHVDPMTDGLGSKRVIGSLSHGASYVLKPDSLQVTMKVIKVHWRILGWKAARSDVHFRRIISIDVWYVNSWIVDHKQED